MPALLPAAAGASAIGTAAIGGATIGTGMALGTGLAAGAALAGGAGLLGQLGLSSIGAPALGGLAGAATPAALTNIAPAALAQATQTIAPSALQSTGLNALKTNVIGGGVKQAAAQQASNLAFQQAAAQNMAGGMASPMSQMGARFLANSPPLARSFGAETLLADASAKVSPNVIQPTSDLATQLQTAQLKGAGASQLPADTAVMSNIRPDQNFLQNLSNISSFQDVKDYAAEHPYATAAGAYGLYKALQPKYEPPQQPTALVRPYDFDYSPTGVASQPYSGSGERVYFNPTFTARTPYAAPGPEYAAAGGLMKLAAGGPVEQMADMNAIGANTGYPMANISTSAYSNPLVQRPEAMNVIAPSADAGVGAYTGEARFAKGGETETEGEYRYSYDPKTMQFTQLSTPTVASTFKGAIGNAMMGVDGTPFRPFAAPATPQPVRNSGSKISGGIATPVTPPAQMQQVTPINVPAYQSPEQQLGLTDFYNMMNQRLAGYGGYAAGGGIADLGDYSDGGRLLKGPGDGVSDSIPASIGGRQPARLADGEFVVPARIVSELGNGSTEAGARKLYAMMDRIQKTRKKSIGKKKVAVNSKADKHLPA